MQGKWFKLIALIVSLVGIYGKKWLGYEKSKKPDIVVKRENKDVEMPVSEKIPDPEIIPRKIPRNGSLDIGLEN